MISKGLKGGEYVPSGKMRVPSVAALSARGSAGGAGGVSVANVSIDDEDGMGSS